MDNYDGSQNTVSDKNYQASSQKFWLINRNAWYHRTLCKQIIHLWKIDIKIWLKWNVGNINGHDYNKKLIYWSNIGFRLLIRSWFAIKLTKQHLFDYLHYCLLLTRQLIYILPLCSPVGWGGRIRWLHPCRWGTPSPARWWVSWIWH